MDSGNPQILLFFLLLLLVRYSCLSCIPLAKGRTGSPSSYPFLLPDCDLILPNRPSTRLFGSFFANVISEWEPADDQSGNLKSSDLQVAKMSSSAFTMAHRMSLAKITLKYKAGVVTTKNYTWNTSSNTASVQNNGTTNVMASNSFSTTSPNVKPYYHTTENNQEFYYYVAKYDEKPQLIDNDATEYQKWTSAIIIQNASSQALGKGNYAAFTATSRAENRAWCYYVAKFPYAGKYQQFSVPLAGTYSLECWGAQGGDSRESALGNIGEGGKGGYVKGSISLGSSDVLYVYVGNKPAVNTTYDTSAKWTNGGTTDTGVFLFNGGGEASSRNNIDTSCGGGASDVRTVKHTGSDGWSGAGSLNSRIIVAGAGGGGQGYQGTTRPDNHPTAGGAGGGLIGYDGSESDTPDNGGTIPTGGTQTSGGIRDKATTWTGHDGGFGYGGNGEHTYFGGGGGSGWYGGGGGGSAYHVSAGGGGSSFISGHPGCTTITGYVFISGTTQMIDGHGKEWTRADQTTGGNTVGIPSKPITTNDGYARITFVSE